jgi:hypothetical protein
LRENVCFPEGKVYSLQKNANTLSFRDYVVIPNEVRDLLFAQCQAKSQILIPNKVQTAFRVTRQTHGGALFAVLNSRYSIASSEFNLGHPLMPSHPRVCAFTLLPLTTCLAALPFRTNAQNAQADLSSLPLKTASLSALLLALVLPPMAGCGGGSGSPTPTPPPTTLTTPAGTYPVTFTVAEAGFSHSIPLTRIVVKN